MTTLYFAYGSNMEAVRMRVRCPDAISLGIARLAQHRFIINRRGVATIVHEPPSKVYGVLWRISSCDERSLDNYEGVSSGLYTKDTVAVLVSGNVHKDVMTYIASDNEVGASRSGYIERIVDAAQYWQLPPHYRQELEQWKTDA